MQCPNCRKTGYVNISGKRFCSNCGTRLDSPVSPATMSDIKQSAQPLDLRPAEPQVSAAASAAVAAAKNAQPAGQLHGKQVGSGIIDLRPQAQIAPPVAPPIPKPVAPLEPPVQQPEIPKAPSVDQAVPPAPAPAPKITPELKRPSLAPQAPAPAVAPQVPQDAPAKSPAIQKLPENPAVTKPVTATAMPMTVASQIDAMRAKAATLAEPVPVQPKSPELQQALAAAKQSSPPSAVKIGAALAAVGIMVAIVWLQNSPKLAFHNAASKAGIEASLPTYMPSSYRQSGPANIAPGQLTLSFNSPGNPSPLKITQRRTEWDSNSLRDNFINRQTDQYLAVQGQGLVIYLYGDQASWVNHGVWYNISGTSKLSREQVVKIAYGL